MSDVTKVSWWKAAGARSLRTAIVVAVPYVPAAVLGISGGNVDTQGIIALASAAGLAAILSLLTSLTGLPEVEGKEQPWWLAILSRVTKTVAQAVIAGVGTAVFFQDVDWGAIWTASLTAGFGSLLLAVMARLPEAEKPLAVASAVVVSTNAETGASVQNAAPVAATVPVAAPIDSGGAQAGVDVAVNPRP